MKINNKNEPQQINTTSQQRNKRYEEKLNIYFRPEKYIDQMKTTQWQNREDTGKSTVKNRTI